MAFCEQCGSKLVEGDAFCSSCGKKLDSGSTNNNNQINMGTFNSFQSNDGGLKSAAKLALYFSGALAILALIALLMGDITGLILSGALVAGVHFGAYMPLQKGQTGSAPTVCIACAAIAAGIGLLVLIKGNGLIGLLDIVAAVPGFMAWQSIKNM